jgi:hypothetical protein
MNCKVGEFINADLADKMPVALIGGASYFLLLKDECAEFRTEYFRCSKNETAARIKQFITFIQNQTRNSVQFFKSDNGTEFVNSELKEYFSKLVIIHQKTAHFCPLSNGSIEREMRTIKDTARAMMYKAKTP